MRRLVLGFLVTTIMATAAAAQSPSEDEIVVCEGDAIEAEARIEACTAIVDTDSHQLAMAYLHRAIAYTELEEFEQAVGDFDRTLSFESDNLRALIGRGLAHFDLRNYALAINDFNHILDLDPEHLIALTNRGTTYRRLGRFARAMSDYDRVLELAPGDSVALIGRGLTRCMTGDPHSAVSDWIGSYENAPVDRRIARQEILANAGYYDGPIDGEMSPTVEEAYRAYAADTCQ